jgi:hypothetical protein
MGGIQKWTRHMVLRLPAAVVTRPKNGRVHSVAFQVAFKVVSKKVASGGFQAVSERGTWSGIRSRSSRTSEMTYEVFSCVSEK